MRRGQRPLFVHVMILALFLAGCRFPRQVTPETQQTGPALEAETATPVSPGPAQPATLTPTELAAVQPATSTAAPDLAVTASPNADLSPTPCPLPDGWVIYTIQPGDTLERLAELTGTGEEVLMSANCLSDDRIIAYEPLFLPLRPPSQGGVQHPPVVGRGASQPTVDCNATLNCIIPGARLFVFAPGPGNPGSYTPCEVTKNAPWIDIHGGALVSISHGDRIFLYACEFTAGGGLAAEAESASGDKFALSAYPYHPVPYLSRGSALGVIDFPAKPDMPTSEYTIRMEVGAQSAALSGVRIDPPKAAQSFILPVPLVASPGDTVDVYYVNFPLDVDLTAVLFSADPPVVSEEYQDGLIPRLTWTTPVTNALTVAGAPVAGPPGWVMKSFSFPSEAILNAYAISDQTRTWRSLIWIR